jgi:hypothetical protein
MGVSFIAGSGGDAEQVTEPDESAVLQIADRAVTAAECLGDLHAGQARQAKLEETALIRRQLGKQPTDGPRGIRREGAVLRSWLGVNNGLCMHKGCMPAFGANRVRDNVGGNRKEPTLDRAAAEARQGGKGLGKDLSGCILGILNGPETAQTEAVDGIDVAIIEQGEGGGICVGGHDEIGPVVCRWARRSAPHAMPPRGWAKSSSW